MISIAVNALFALSLLSLVQAEICSLCATPMDMPVSSRWEYRVADGRTCRQVYLDLGSVTDSNAACRNKAQMQKDCCDAGEPDEYQHSPTAAPLYQGVTGDEPDCPICGTREFPGIPNAFIVARYVGEFTCVQLYHRGLNGMTPNFMCPVLQDFAEPVCGCGDYNPKCKSDPTQCYGYSGPGPVPQPVPAPIPAPLPYVEPTVYDRKVPPTGGNKAGGRLSDSQGGSAGRLRGVAGNRRTTEEVDSEVQEVIVEVDDTERAEEVETTN
jgi:hypothetical protein